MLKTLKKSAFPQKFISFSPRFSYESMWTRFFRFFKKSSITNQSLYHEDLKKSEPLSEHMPFQYKIDETKPKTITPIMTLEAQLREIEQQKEISEIERARMKEIDKTLGTNTYFHEVEPHEERLNSETLMERTALEEFAVKDDFLEKLVSLDPQQKVTKPPIRNFHEFAKKAFEMRKYPKHLKENTVFTNQFESFPDNYKYLDFSINDQMLQNKLDFLANNQDFKKYMDFLGQETMYTNYSLARMQRIEEKISKEYFSLVGGFNVQPLHYDDWIYYSKDPRLTSKSIFDVYRVKVPKNTQDQNLIKVTDIHPSQEEIVLTIQEIIDFLTPEISSNEEISNYIESLTSNTRGSPAYKEFCFDKNHKIMAIVLDLPTNLTIFKNIETNTILKSVLKGVNEVLMDQTGGVYYIRTNDLERKCFLMYHKINDIDRNGQPFEKIIYQENDLNYELKVKKTNNYDEGLLICQKIGGTPSNEIGLIDLKSSGETPKIERTFDRKQEIFWILKSNEEAFYFSPKNSKKIFRIFRQPQTQNLTLINQNLSKKELLFDGTPVETVSSNEKTSSMKKRINSETNILSETEQKNYLVESFQKQENYEVFFEAKNDEELKNFEVFKHYVLIQVISNSNEHFKVYNCKNRSFHTVFIPEPLFEVRNTYLQNYTSQYFNFTLATPHLPTKLMTYNMALREFLVLYAHNYPGVDFANYTIEKVEAIARDGKKIPVTFIYNKTKVNDNSVVILHAEYYYKKTMKREFQPEIITLLDRGFIYAFPHIRGSSDINDEWFEEGSGLKKLTMICDYIDTALFILKHEIAQRIFAYGVNHLGGLCAIMSILREPKLFSASIIDNGIFDIVEFFEKSQNQKELKAIFGDFEEKINYDFIKSYNPYHLKKISIRNCFITSDTKSEFSGNSRKFVAKIRENENNLDTYYKEFSVKDVEKEKFFQHAAFFTEMAFKKNY